MNASTTRPHRGAASKLPGGPSGLRRHLPGRRLAAPIAAASLAWLCSLPHTVRAQSNWGEVAIPAYSGSQVLEGLYRHWGLPRAEAFGTESKRLVAALATYCDGGKPGNEDARTAWRSTMQAWERLSAVAIGPLVERRSTRAIDFAPTRPALIERAIKAEPRGAAALERVGTPAKGLPALEWLLWTQPAAPKTPACAYAVEIAGEVERESAALREGFVERADAMSGEDPDPEAARAGFEQFLNQWVGGLAKLRWAQLDKPRKAAVDGRPDWPRAASGGTAEAWAAQWASLKELGLFAGGTAPAAGAGAVPIETLLRSRGLNPAADAWAKAIRGADTRMAGLQPGQGKRIDEAVRALGTVQEQVEGKVAPALDVGIGFSDADGD